jgi:hypothetical protein
MLRFLNATAVATVLLLYAATSAFAIQAPQGGSSYTRTPYPNGASTTGTAAFGPSGNGQSTDSAGVTRTYLWDAQAGEYVVRVNNQNAGEMVCFDNSPPPGAVGYVETDNNGQVVATGTITPVS